MSNGNVYERILKLFTQVMKLVMDGKRDAHKLADFLQGMLEEKTRIFELFLHDRQKGGGCIKGFDLEKYLIEQKLFDRCLSLEDEVVQIWLARAETYPEEYKGKAIFLWKSQRDSGDRRYVAYLIWSGGRVVVDWFWLGSGWNGYYPALLASS